MSLLNSSPRDSLRTDAMVSFHAKELIVPAPRMPHCLIKLLLDMAFNTGFVVINNFAMEHSPLQSY
jgi:hypothetical protein